MKFDKVNRYKGVTTNCKTSEEFASNIEAVYLQQTRKGYDGAWIAKK
jgi:hypothetical protein